MDNATAPSISLRDIFSMTVGFIKAAEAAYPAGGKGQEKLEAVTAQVMAFAPLVSLGLDLLDKLLPTFISTTVSLYNKLGVFKPSA